MTDLERRLRTGLGALARGVPPSDDAWAEQQRRIALARRPARPMLAAAAVALVLAVLVSLSILNRPAGPAAGPPATQSLPPIYQPNPEDPYLSTLSGPFDLGAFVSGSGYWRAETFVDRHLEPGGAWVQRVCIVIAQVMTDKLDGPATPYPPDCAPLHGGQVESRAVQAAGAPPIGPMPGRLLFVTVPQVASLDVCAGDRSPAEVTELTRTSGLVLYRADFPGSTEGFCFTAWDAQGRVLQSGIS